MDFKEKDETEQKAKVRYTIKAILRGEDLTQIMSYKKMVTMKEKSLPMEVLIEKSMRVPLTSWMFLKQGYSAI